MRAHHLGVTLGMNTTSRTTTPETHGAEILFIILGCANSDTSLIFSARHKVMESRDVFTDKLLKRVQELGLDLMNEGAITIPPLEWDGSLGPSEVNVIERLGFLLDAYHARVWYWEIIEMLRKLILTSVLVVIYN